MKEKLKTREWRLNNLYWIKNDQGERIKFRLNWAQRLLFNGLWYLNIVLKVRQLGVTTFFCILYLDDVLFNGYDAGLIAHTLQDATKIFDTKIKYPFDNLPEAIKAEYQVDTDNTRELKFKRGDIESSIYVGTSLRSGTVQRLHISELGVMDQKYPKKAIDIQSGALNTVHVGQLITIESTARGQIGVFHDLCQEALKNKQRKLKLTEMDYKFFFLPWWKHPQYELQGDIAIPSDMQDYFRQLEATEKIKLTQAKKNWYYKKSLMQGEQMKSEYPSTPDEAFEASIEGAYYGKQLTQVYENKQITQVPYLPHLTVDTWWDLGTSKARKDSTSIWFTQDVGLEIHVIDFYGNTGEGLAHYKKVLDDKGYIYGRHWAPHDIMVKEFTTGKTRYESAKGLGLHFDVVPNIPFPDGIEAVRMILPKCWFDEERTATGVKALASYRKEWDDTLGKFKDNPLKDWASDPADAFRMMAVGHRDHMLLGYYDDEEQELEQIKNEQSAIIDASNPFAM